MIWEGVYERWEELPPYDLLDLYEWDTKQRVKLKEVIEDSTLVCAESDFLLSTLSFRDRTFVDYGGSLALTYQAIKEIVPIDAYYVIETPTIVRSGSSIFVDGVVHFHTIDHEPEKIDVLYIRTALQYAQDWRKDLEALLKWNPNRIVLAHTSAGPVPTYLTIQHWYGKKIPYWFINEDELIEAITASGYKLDTKEVCENIRSGFLGGFGQVVPMDHILDTTINLSFSKT